MPLRSSTLTDALSDWLQIHGKVVFTFAVFNVMLIVFCVVYWGIGLPMYPLNVENTTTTDTPNWFMLDKSMFLGSNMLDGFQKDFSNIVFNFYVMQWCIFFLAVYMAYILREMYYVQLHSQRVVHEGLEGLNRILNLIRYEPQALTYVIQGVQALKDNVNEKCDGFEDLLRKIIRIMPEHPIDIRDAVYSFQDMTEDLLTKIKREIRMLRIDSANNGEEKEEMVDLSGSSTEAPVVPTITPKPKRGRKMNTPSSASSSIPLLSSTRLSSRRANEMLQATISTTQ